MSQTLYFEVHGIPAPKGSVNAFPIQRKGGRWGTVVTHSAKSKAWEKEVREKVKDLPKLLGPLSVELWFFLPRPKTVTRFYPEVIPDLDKLVRAVLDALNEKYADDSRVVDLDVHKRYVQVGFEAGVVGVVRDKVEDPLELGILSDFMDAWRTDPAIHKAITSG